MKAKKVKKQSPFGNRTPWAWAIEPTHGCNLRCWHCSCRLDELGMRVFISDETWAAAFEIMQRVSPMCRVDLCLGGEPTLHPRLPDLLRAARRICPLMQLQITNNGTMLVNEKWTYDTLLGAGANIIYTDMYAPRSKHIALAEASSYPWYEYYGKNPKKLPSPWTYTGPELKMIVLQENPSNWPESRKRANLIGTWYNHLDWKAAAHYGIKPVTQAPRRRCNQPFRYVVVGADGHYLLCCQDNTWETAGKFGSVQEGYEGFLHFWFGEKLQWYRINLLAKRRDANSECSRCSITFSRCDVPQWSDKEVSTYWDGQKWVPMGPAVFPKREDAKQGLFKLPMVGDRKVEKI